VFRVRHIPVPVNSVESVSISAAPDAISSQRPSYSARMQLTATQSSGLSSADLASNTTAFVSNSAELQLTDPRSLRGLSSSIIRRCCRKQVTAPGPRGWGVGRSAVVSATLQIGMSPMARMIDSFPRINPSFAHTNDAIVSISQLTHFQLLNFGGNPNQPVFKHLTKTAGVGVASPER